MKQNGPELRLTHSGDKGFRALAEALDREYLQRFGDLALQYRQYNGPEDLEQVCLLVLDGQAAACGAYRRLDGATAELKRVYVRPECRRRGYAGQLIGVLELQALFGGYTRMALETGRDMEEAVRLYKRLGYQAAPAWGPFAGDDVCLCMDKELK